jgi:tripartite-type tricarboxylate transporter receptor subunit TctC
MTFAALFRTLATVLGACVALLGSAHAQGTGGWPNKPVRIIAIFAPGGSSDLVARQIAQHLSTRFGQQFIVENKVGAGGNLGVDFVAKSAPDGYTLALGTSGPLANNKWLYKPMPFDAQKDLTPIALVGEIPLVIAINPSVPANNLKEFVALVKANPGKYNYSSAGNGSQPHLAAELFKSMTGTNLVHVPYKGGPPAMTDLIAGHVSASFATAPSAVPNVKSGKIKALGVSTTRRIPALPDVPTIAEAGVSGYEAIGYFGLVGPPGLPPALVEKINAAVVRILKDPAMAKYLSEQGAEPLTSTPAEYAALIRDEVSKWGKVVKESGAKID